MKLDRITFISIVLIIIFGFAVYANSLHGEFIRDDRALIRDNIYIKSGPKVFRYFYENIAIGGGQKWNSYRPLQMFTYMIDYSIWKLNVRGYHLTNTLLHILVALSIYWLINILYDDKILSLLTGLFFVVHPIHTEAVSYISGRADSLAAVFLLVSFIFYLKSLHTKSIIFYLLMIFSFIFALLSRENSLILPLLLLLYHCSFRKKLHIYGFVSVLTLSFIYILLRLTLLRSLLFNISYSSTWIERVPGFFVAITNYIRLLFLPFSLHTAYGVKLFKWGEPKAILGVLILISLLIYAARKRDIKGLRFFAISWFLVALLPQSNLYPINAYMAEHWLYLPSIGFFLILADGISVIYKTKQLKRFALFLIITLLAFYSFLTIRQNEYWREPIAFYQRTLKYAADDYSEYNNLGVAYQDIGKYEKAIAEYKKAIKLNPSHAELYFNIALSYRSLGKIKEATSSFKKAIELNPDVRTYSNLADTYKTAGKYKEAIEVLKTAIQLNPDHAGLHYDLGGLYSFLGKNEEAVAAFKKVIGIDSNYAPAYNDLGIIYMILGRHKEAMPLLKKAIELEPHAGTYYNLALVYFQQKQYTLAIETCDKAREMGFAVDPNFLRDLAPHRQ